MIFECEGKPVVQNPKPQQIRKVIKSLRSYGPSSYASLTDGNGNYLQVAGGGVTCMLEQYRVATKERLRAFQNVRNKVFPDGTLLVFGAGSVPMKADEWLAAEKVADIFCAFLEGADFSLDVHWRESSESGSQ